MTGTYFICVRIRIFSSIRTLSVWRLCTNTLLGEQLTMQSDRTEAMSKARFMMHQSFP
nr:MAG TPA: hypothetical protein [Caudoviricetes sp.]